MIRVALDCRMADWTGVGRYTVGLARALHARDDVELVIVTVSGATIPEGLAGFEFVSALGHPFRRAGARGLGRALSRIEPDLVHCPHFPTPSPTVFPTVVALHDLSPLLVPGVMPSLVKRMVYRRMVARAARIARRILVPSQHTAADVERLIAAARGKVRVSLLAADDFSAGSLEPLNGRVARFCEHPYVFSMGSTRPHKDLPTLLRAFELIATSKPELRLLLAGVDVPGFVDECLPSASADVRARVAFTGRVTDGELRTLYSGSAVFAFPSRYEGFGLPPLEAMALGAPVVVARAASLPEVVGDAALQFTPGDSAELAQLLCDVLDDLSLRNKLVESGLKRSRELSWARTAAETVAVYREALGA